MRIVICKFQTKHLTYEKHGLHYQLKNDFVDHLHALKGNKQGLK